MEDLRPWVALIVIPLHSWGKFMSENDEICKNVSVFLGNTGLKMTEMTHISIGVVAHVSLITLYNIGKQM